MEGASDIDREREKESWRENESERQREKERVCKREMMKGRKGWEKREEEIGSISLPSASLIHSLVVLQDRCCASQFDFLNLILLVLIL